LSLKIAITGKMRSGKSEAASYLKEMYGFTVVGLGDGIKRICSELFPDQVRNGKNRELYQAVGQTLRHVDEDVWVNHTLGEISYVEPLGMAAPHFVVPDLRQPNEYHRLLGEGFVIVRVNATDDVRRERIARAGDVFHPEDFYHETEQFVDTFDVDFEIDNNDEWLVALWIQLDEVVEKIRGGEPFGTC
jgi:hypothetical protein